VERRHRAGRLKQWLNHMRHRHPEAQQAFDALRLHHDPAAIEAWLEQAQAPQGRPAPAPAEMVQPC